MTINPFSPITRLKNTVKNLSWESLHIDPPLLFLMALLIGFGLLILFSASNQNMFFEVKQIFRLGVGFIILLIFACIPPKKYHTWAAGLFIFALLLLVLVLVVGKINKGAQRWLDMGFLEWQPSELMKIALPLMLARYFSQKNLPPSLLHIVIASLLLIVPVILTAKQPDLGTALIISISGLSLILLAGMPWRLIIIALSMAVIGAPVLWHFMHTYQKDRVLTFLHPERDPLGTGYHIIQSKIAIGSGGIWGKGFLEGTQSHLKFLPAHATDFIFAVNSEEFGLMGASLLLCLLFAIFSRCLFISHQAQDTFTRLLSGSLSLTFIVSSMINIGMVVGILPVVGVPLPLVSYGGSSIVTIMAGFGIIMSIHTHKKLWAN